MYELTAIIVSIFAVLIAGIGLGWNIYRDYIDKPKLKINIALWTSSIAHQKSIQAIVTNIGKQAIVISRCGFRKKDKTKYIYPETLNQTDNKKLTPHDSVRIVFSNESFIDLINNVNDLSTFIVSDTTGQEWSTEKKIMKEFLKDLKKINLNP
jgi:hypothetical protein